MNRLVIYIVFVLIFLSVGGPVYWLIASTRGFLFGLPYSIIWLIACSLLTSATLFILDSLDTRATEDSK